MATPIRVLLADDHALFRAGIRALLGKNSEIEVVAEAADGKEVLRQVGTVQPDVILMDVSMPGLGGLEATAYLTKNWPQVRVLMLSMHDNGQYAVQALRAGAKGYLLKDAAVAELEEAVRVIMRGETYLSPALAQYVFDDYQRRLSDRSSPAHEPLSEAEHLPPRQREVLQLIAEGNTSKEIAALLHVSEKTVEVHRTRLMQRLDIHDVASLVRYAIRIGLVSADT